MDSALSRTGDVVGFDCETKWLWDLHDEKKRVPDGNQAVGKGREVQSWCHQPAES